MNYGELLKDPRWQRKRLEIMQRDDFHCRACNAENSTLNVHHSHYRSGAEGPWDYPETALITLCETCHRAVHSYGGWAAVKAAPTPEQLTLQELASVGLLTLVHYPAAGRGLVVPGGWYADMDRRGMGLLGDVVRLCAVPNPPSTPEILSAFEASPEDQQLLASLLIEDPEWPEEKAASIVSRCFDLLSERAA